MAFGLVTAELLLCECTSRVGWLRPAAQYQKLSQGIHPAGNPGTLRKLDERETYVVGEGSVPCYSISM